MIRGFFVSAPSTNSGKTFVIRGLARAIARAGGSLVALKPIETGVSPEPSDAIAIARACGRPPLAHAQGLFRAALPLAPYAVSLETGEPVPDLVSLAARVRELATGEDVLLVEGAGGLLVPLTATASIADLARALSLPLLLVAQDRLGVLSSVLTCAESAERHQLVLGAVVLVERGTTDTDLSPQTNRRILQERLSVPVFAFPHCRDDDDALADAAEHSGLLALLSPAQPSRNR
jgi:dethiobiotin synthetase